MTVRQAGAPITDEEFLWAVMDGGDKASRDASSPLNKSGPVRPVDTRCRLYPKLSFFFDGTGNNLEIDLPLNRLSNIAKLSRLAVNNRTGRHASRIYIPGVGTPFKFPKLIGYTDKLADDPGGKLGLGLGRGGDVRIEYALAEFSRILKIDWSSASWRCMQFINVAIFGFSRGATEARAFARKLIERNCERTESGLIWIAPNGERVPLRITFMGLFDTVASVGGPSRHFDWASELAIPPEVERCVHYVSAHEVRAAFPLDSVRVDQTYPSNCEEVVYPGVHSDVGGGYAPDEQGRSNLLARIPLRHMLADAIRAGVPMNLPSQLSDDQQEDYALPDSDPLVHQYLDYMASLPEPEGNDVEALIQVHRRAQFRWRSALERQPNDYRVLGRLYGKVSLAACAKVPPATDADHPKCKDHEWEYEIPRDPGEQAVQLLREQRRLAERVAFLRHPVERRSGDRSWPPPEPRMLTAYENLILSAWDDCEAISSSVDALLAEHVHDSVAHFTSWPCALYDPRGVYCDSKKYYADANTGVVEMA